MSTEQAVKVYCPVCGQEVDPSSAPSLTYQDKTYYFKCHRCMQRFMLAPELFVGAEREQRNGHLRGRRRC